MSRTLIGLLVALATVLPAQQALQIGRPFQGTFDPRRVEDYQGDKVIWHSISLNRNQSVVIRAESVSDSKLVAILPDGTNLSNDDTFGLDPALFVSNVAGQVRVGFAYLDASKTDPYRIFVENLPPGTPLTGASIQGALDNRSPRIGNFPVQVFTYNMPANQRVIFEVNSDFDNKLILIDPRGQVFVDDDSAGNSNARIVSSSTQAGRAVLIVQGYSAEAMGPFTLKAAVPPPPIPITVGRQVLGKLTGNEVTLGYQSGDGYSQQVAGVEYVLNARRGVTYVVRMESEQFDTYLELKNGETVRTDDDGGGGTNSRISFVAEVDGPVYILARPYNAGDRGDFKLQVTESRPLQTYQGNLGPGAQRDISGKYFGIHEFRGQPGTTVAIRLESSDFDTLLIVQDARMEKLAENDDSSEGGTNSMVSVTLPADGFIRILATNYGSDVLSGAYTVTVLLE